VKDPSVTVAPLLALESPWSRTFDSPALEWRRLFSEFLGTFLLVLVGAGGAVVDAVSGGEIGRAAGVAAPGLLVLAVILFMGVPRHASAPSPSDRAAGSAQPTE
jgi:aquaporin Z